MTSRIDTIIMFYAESENANCSVALTESQLNKYPDSFLTTAVSFHKKTGKNPHRIPIRGITSDALESIGEFYREGVWKINPFDYTQKKKFTMIEYGDLSENNFWSLCEFLNLPCELEDMYLYNDEFKTFEEYIDADYNLHISLYIEPDSSDSEDQQDDYRNNNHLIV